MTTDLSNVQSEGWVSLRQFLKIANITYPTALRWVKMGMIRYVQVGHTKRIYASEIKRFLEKGTLPPDPTLLAEEKQKRAKWLPGNEHLRSQTPTPQQQNPQQQNLQPRPIIKPQTGDPRDG